MNSQKTDLYIFRFLLVISAIVLGYIAIFSKVHYTGSESIYHFFHAKAIFQHPEIMINHWGKPLFIILSAPFSYFGETGAKLFNVVVMLLSAYFAFKIGKKLGFKYAFPAVFLVIFAPVYLPFAQSALTEPLFGLVALVGAYLFLNQKYIASAIVISFIIFARSEGMMFILIYAFAYILKKEYKSIPFLFFGFILYGFLGILFNHGFFWYYYDYPYNGAVDIYGKGPFWNYFIHQKNITGTPFSVYIFGGFILLLIKVLRKPLSIFKGNNLVLNVLIVLPSLVYIFAHSYLWYKGLGSSLGLHRIVGAVFPLLAILALFGMDKLVVLLEKIPKYGKQISIIVLLVFGLIMIKNTYRNRSEVILIQPDVKEKLILKSIDYIEENNLDTRKLYVYQAHFIAKFDGDHFDGNNSKVQGGISNPKQPESCTKKDDIIVWDGHVSPNEGRLPIQNLENNTNFKELIEFRPEEEFKVLGGGFYYIKIFERI